MHCGGDPVVRRTQNCRPEQSVEIGNVLADEMMNLHVCGRVKPILFRFAVPDTCAVMLGSCNVTYGSIQPYIEILVLFARNLESEIRPIPRNIPVLKALLNPGADKCPDFILQVAGFGNPTAQELAKILESEKEVLGCPQRRCRA